MSRVLTSVKDVLDFYEGILGYYIPRTTFTEHRKMLNFPSIPLQNKSFYTTENLAKHWISGVMIKLYFKTLKKDKRCYKPFRVLVASENKEQDFNSLVLFLAQIWKSY